MQLSRGSKALDPLEGSVMRMVRGALPQQRSWHPTSGVWVREIYMFSLLARTQDEVSG
jgi:hypothetical protein